jgi:hypothetical protein
MFNNTFLRRFTNPSVVANATSRISKSLLVSSSSSLVATNTLLLNSVRFNSEAAASATTTSTSSNNNNNRNFDRRSNNNNRNNNNRNNNNNNNRIGNNRQQEQQSRSIGSVEFYDVRDTPKDGREMRLVFRKDAQRDSAVGFLSITIRPQLGPRKTDPHDPTPQFDQQNRLSLRLKPKEISTLLFWLEGRSGPTVQSVEVSGQSYKISLARQDSGVVVCTIAGVKLDGTMSDPLSYELQPHQQIQFRAFLENSLFAIWGLPSF